jgi:hypothetical protein
MHRVAFSDCYVELTSTVLLASDPVRLMPIVAAKRIPRQSLSEASGLLENSCVAVRVCHYSLFKAFVGSFDAF